jgi:hypothetical protein
MLVEGKDPDSRMLLWSTNLQEKGPGTLINLLKPSGNFTYHQV